ncbi:MAG: cytochrome c [Polyangiaceae bacterium]|nr:cytochrome c [Polyangiaceae bacterium]
MRRAAILPIALAALAGCGSDPTEPRLEILPDMVDAVPYESFAQSPVTRDGKAMIRPPEGTVARGHLPFRYGPGPDEAARAGRELSMPPMTPADVKRGDAAFQTFCSPCHGKTGLGDGAVIPRFPTPPSLVASHAKSMPDGQIFHVISRGQGVMPSHAAQVLPADRWKIVAFIRSLQAADQGAKR